MLPYPVIHQIIFTIRMQEDPETIEVKKIPKTDKERINESTGFEFQIPKWNFDFILLATNQTQMENGPGTTKILKKHSHQIRSNNHKA